MPDPDAPQLAVDNAGSKPVLPPTVDSRALLRGSNHIHILHAGQVYTLRRTKENKLILTK